MVCLSASLGTHTLHTSTYIPLTDYSVSHSNTNIQHRRPPVRTPTPTSNNRDGKMMTMGLIPAAAVVVAVAVTSVFYLPIVGRRSHCLGLVIDRCRRVGYTNRRRRIFLRWLCLHASTGLRRVSTNPMILLYLQVEILFWRRASYHADFIEFHGIVVSPFSLSHNHSGLRYIVPTSQYNHAKRERRERRSLYSTQMFVD